MYNYFHEISVKAEATAPDELVGFLYADVEHSLRFQQLENLKRGEEFKVKTADVLAAYNTRSLFAFVHSHVTSDDSFSAADKRAMAASGLPWLLYSVKTHVFNFERPVEQIPPLLDRQFILGLQDCVQLVEDYYELLGGLKFPFFSRAEYSLHNGYSLDRVVLGRVGFEEIRTEPRIHDLLLFSGRINGPGLHVGVYLGDNRVLHQPALRQSEITLYSKAWQRLTRGIYRNEKFTSKLSIL